MFRQRGNIMKKQILHNRFSYLVLAARPSTVASRVDDDGTW